MKLEGFEPPTFGSGIRRAANCAIASHKYINLYKHSWPSGLRRCVQVAVSSEAWVQTPQDAYIINTLYNIIFIYYCNVMYFM